MADVIGPAAAVRLANTFGGTEDNYIPKTARLDHPFVPVIGKERFQSLCEEFGGERLDIPRGAFRRSKKAAILNAAETMPARELALRVGATQRYVRSVRSMTRDDKQGDLFGES